jgi:hypothetical protein
MSTRWVNFGIAYDHRALDSRDPTIAIAPELNLEKFRFSVSRNIPVLNVDFGLSFASSTGTVSAALGRELFIPQLRGSVSTVRSVRPTQGNYGEERIQLNFAHSF